MKYCSPCRAEVEEFFTNMDRDFDGKLSFAEFMGEETTLENLRDMARVREEEEMSVAYARRRSSTLMTNGDLAAFANAAHAGVTGEGNTGNGTSACAATAADCAEAESCGAASRSRPGRQGRVLIRFA